MAAGDPPRKPQDARRCESQRNETADCHAPPANSPTQAEDCHDQQDMRDRAAADQAYWTRAQIRACGQLSKTEPIPV